MIDADKAVPEIEVEVGGKKYKFVFTVKALVLAERATKANVFKGDLLQSINLDQLIALVWAGLQKHHPDVSLAQVEEMISFQEVAQFKTAISTGLQRAAPPGGNEKKTQEAASSTS